MNVDVAYVVCGIVVPVATFTGVSLWRLRGSAAPDKPSAAQYRETELAQSLTAVRAGLDGLREEIVLWNQELEERDRKLAERISGLIDVTKKAARIGNPLAAALDDPRQAEETRRGV